jgi:hypothetical protein
MDYNNYFENAHQVYFVVFVHKIRSFDLCGGVRDRL